MDGEKHWINSNNLLSDDANWKPQKKIRTKECNTTMMLDDIFIKMVCDDILFPVIVWKL